MAVKREIIGANCYFLKNVLLLYFFQVWTAYIQCSFVLVVITRLLTSMSIRLVASAKSTLTGCGENAPYLCTRYVQGHTRKIS